MAALVVDRIRVMADRRYPKPLEPIPRGGFITPVLHLDRPTLWTVLSSFSFSRSGPMSGFDRCPIGGGKSLPPVWSGQI
jgi:hypothetical protein